MVISVRKAKRSSLNYQTLHKTHKYFTDSFREVHQDLVILVFLRPQHTHGAKADHCIKGFVALDVFTFCGNLLTSISHKRVVAYAVGIIHI